MTVNKGGWIVAIVVVVLAIIFWPRDGHDESITQPDRPGLALSEQAEAESEPEAEPTASPAATKQIMVPVQQVMTTQDTVTVEISLDEYLAKEVAAQVEPLQKMVAVAEARNKELTEAMQQPALTVIPKPEVTVVTTTVTEAVSEEPTASGPVKLAAYWQGGKTYVSLDAVQGDPPYYRYGGKGGTWKSGWSLDKRHPLYPENGWLVLNAEYDRFQIVSLYPDGSVQDWSEICETFRPSDQGVYIVGGDCLYSPIRR